MRGLSAKRIYVGIRANGVVKIGIAQFPEPRAHGLKIMLLGHWPGTQQQETAIHRQFRASRIARREWYADTPEIAAFILERTGQTILTGRITHEDQVGLRGKATSVLFPADLHEHVKKAASITGQPLATFIRNAARDLAASILPTHLVHP